MSTANSTTVPDLERKLRAAEERAEGLDQRLGSADTTLKTANAKVQSLEDQIRIDDVTSLRQQIQTLQGDLKQANNKLSKAESDLKAEIAKVVTLTRERGEY